MGLGVRCIKEVAIAIYGIIILAYMNKKKVKYCWIMTSGGGGKSENEGDGSGNNGESEM